MGLLASRDKTGFLFWQTFLMPFAKRSFEMSFQRAMQGKIS